VVFTAGRQSVFQAVPVEAHHKVNVTILRERSERSGFSVYYCQNEVPELLLADKV